MKITKVVLLTILYGVFLFKPTIFVSANENQEENAEILFRKGFNSYFCKNPDHQSTLNYLLRSSALNYAPANFLLGQIYESGNAVKKDLRAAINYYTLSSNGNYVQASLHLAKIYLNPEGIYYNPAEAIKLLTGASGEKPDEAFYYLGMIYEQGNGVDININKAIKYYDMSANYDYLKSQESLGRIYSHGKTKEIANSVFWYSIAVKRHGSIHSMTKLKEFEKILGKEAITSMSKIVESWAPTKKE